jgi:alpha-L-rhamnosidase
VLIRSETEPVLTSGESVEEAKAEEATSETRHTLVQVDRYHWRSSYQLGLRYLSVRSATPGSVVVEASVRPVRQRGAFVCSDDTLNRIWGTSAYTLRCCMQGLMIDGIKRDRMPWAGDQALSTLANAYTFGDATIANDSSTASGLPRRGYVNGISDYSLWWVINNGLLQRYFGDSDDNATRRAAAVHEFMADLSRHTSVNGIFRPAAIADGFADTGAGSIFLDWGVAVEPGRDLTALQMLWVWALRSAADLLDRAAHDAAPRWRQLADDATTTVTEQGWDSAAGAWREYLGPGSRTDSAYPNFLAVLNGMSANTFGAGTIEAIAHGTVGTPFMSAFALRAQGLAGQRQGAIQRIRHRWGEMLDAAALTFWEEFDSGEGDRYAMYGRPFGKSLCHAWSAGPAALLPELVLGIRPLVDGWRRFEVAPELGELQWAGAVIPMLGGEPISVSVDHGQVDVDVPGGLTLERRDGELAVGPCRATWTMS